MDLDHSFLSELPLQQRQKICKQIRQKQIDNYFKFERSQKGKEGKDVKNVRKANKKKTAVHFHSNILLQVAVDTFDDKEVARYLKKGGDPDFKTGNGTSLLHRCVSEDNVTGAELLLSHKASVNILDDDWWTPLHLACNCDSPEVLQLLLNNGADPEAIDVDGYFPIDHASDGSEVKLILTKHMENKGLTAAVLHVGRQRRAQDFLNHVKSLPLAADVNQILSNGSTLLHIAAANGYKSCLKALFKYDPDVDKLDSYGWSPLHVAARFNQLKSVELLLKKRANTNLKDSLGNKPSAVTSSDDLRGLLMRHERKQELKLKMGNKENRGPSSPHVPGSPHYLELSQDGKEENVYNEIEDVNIQDDSQPDMELVGMFRINSKTVKAKHGSISKEDELLEAKTRYEALLDLESLPPPPPSMLEPLENPEEPKEDEDEGDYVSYAIWKSGSQKEGRLADRMENDNLVSMAMVRDDTLLVELQKRFVVKQIYTNIGDVMIAVNPFKPMPYYSKDISTRYHANERHSMPPHVYGIAEHSFKNLLREQTSQCHVISGESGSGKTETCKYIIQHLLRVAGSEETNLNSKINQVNPLLEAFGNAVTVMNNNSSRFGKHVQLGFTPGGKVTGAMISEYLLEKSRVVHQGDGEFNFHIFYWMMAGLSPEEINVYKLDKMKHMRYLKSTSTDYVYASLSENKEKFWEVKDCLKFIGFSSTDIQNVMLTLSTVLHIGEIEFYGMGNNEAAQVKNVEELLKVSELLEVSMDELGSALVADYTVTRGEQIKKERTVQQAEACRDALSKTLYGRLFSWIVNGINQLIQPAEEQRMELNIGILDIFGFENFPRNSFEQMCINVANEQFQMYTNENIFYKEQQDCLLEGVPLVELNYATNQPILDLFLERHTGVFAILDEESSFPKATDRSLATKLHQNTGDKHSQYYKTPKDKGQSFTVIHYAGSVRYDVIGMLEKNRDTLPNSIVYTMKTSNRLLMKELFQSRVTRTGSLAPSARQQRSRRTTMKKSSSPFEFFKKLRGGNKDQKKPVRMTTAEKKGPSTVAFNFRNSLLELVGKLQAASPHFVRCIKPNTNKSPMEFTPEYVLAQLRYTGISEIVKIRKHGYALIITFYDFLYRYQALVQCCLPKFCPVSEQEKCAQVFQYYKIKDVRFGKKKLFAKQEEVERLEELTRELVLKVTRAQSVIRGFLGRQRSKQLKSVRAEQKRAMSSFGSDINSKADVLRDSLMNCPNTELDEFQLQLKKNELTEITNSLGTLDDIISEYETVLNTSRSGPTTTTDDDDNDMYDDAISVQRHRQDGDSVFEEPTEEDMNGHIQHRGLPPTPTHGNYMDTSRPPPCPREMYSQGMYATIDDQMEHRKVAPPPPRRNPETRLSTASVSSNSSIGNYEELHVEESAHHHQQQHPGFQYHPSHENMSPRHMSQGSPIMSQKFSHEPQSPSHAGNRPFSYGAPLMHSPKHKVAPSTGNQFQYNQQQNGHSQTQVLQNYQYTEMHSASPATSYGKHESAFHPQPHRPPPHGPPPPPPGGQGQRGSPSPHPQSPKLQRHSIPALDVSQQQRQPMRSPGSPKMTPKLSQRSQSVPSSTLIMEHGYMPDQQLTPVSLGGDYMIGYHGDRAPSPPLPPPPPEMLESYTEHSPSPPPPLPTNMSNVPHTSYNQSLPQSQPVAMPTSSRGYHSQSPQRSEAQVRPPPPPLSSIPTNQNISPDRKVNVQKSAVSPDKMVAPKGGNSNGNKSREGSPATDELQKKLNRIQLRNADDPKMSHSDTTADSSVAPFAGVKLRPTGARSRLLGQNELSGQNEEPSPEVAQPPPQAPPVETLSLEPTPKGPPRQLSPSEDMFEKRLEIIQNKIKGQDDTSNNSKDITMDNIDLNEVPGYTPITKATPIWKRDMIEKKNQEKIEEYIALKQREKEEEAKWKHVPEWKRKLMKEKEKEKQTKTVEEIQKAADEEANRKRRIKEAEDERKARIKEEQERSKEMEKELEDVPAWKREIMMKRGGAIKNWGDEREGINEQSPGFGYEDREDDIDQGYESNCPPQGADSVPEKSKSKAPPPAPKRMSLDEARLEEEWDSLPLWKREVLMKRGGAPSNWGDEREDVDE